VTLYFTPQIRDLGKGSFGDAKLMLDMISGERVAVKFLARGPKVCPCASAASCPIATNLTKPM
jgi:hypothetical protein